MSNELFDATRNVTCDPSEAIITAVAERENVTVTEVPPLYDTIDSEALDRLFDGRRPGEVTFEYAGYEVTVRGPDRISIRESRA